jgi:hypothetical protein
MLIVSAKAHFPFTSLFSWPKPTREDPDWRPAAAHFSIANHPILSYGVAKSIQKSAERWQNLLF